MAKADKALKLSLCMIVKNEQEDLPKCLEAVKKFVDEIMQSTEFQRHSDPKAKKKLSDEECKSRTKILIQAYADSL